MKVAAPQSVAPKRSKEWGMNGWRNAVVVPMFNIHTEEHEFDIVIYGMTKEEAMQVPNHAIHSLARRYPNYFSNIFEVGSTDDK